MSRTEVLSTCTTQLGNSKFCDAAADPRFPNRICASHAIKTYLAVRDFINDHPALAAAAITLLEKHDR